MKVLAFPWKGNSYNEQFYRAVEAAGAIVEEGIFAGGWLLEHLRPGDVVHIHYPSFCYAGRGSRVSLCGRFLRFVSLLLLIRARSGRILWTAHNVMPHDRSQLPFLDVLGRRIIIALSERIFVHGKHAADILVGRFPSARSKLVLVQHGHWIGYYPSGVSRVEARRRLGISESAFVYLFIGLCKEYKNLDGLIRAYVQIPGDTALLIAGKFQSESYRNTIEILASSDPRVRLDPRFIPDDEMQNYLVAADVVVAPYREVLTSGTAMLALSFGRPVVSVRLGCLVDVVTSEAGILYDPDQPQGLVDALTEIRRRQFRESDILARARQFDWGASAKSFLASLS